MVQPDLGPVDIEKLVQRLYLPSNKAEEIQALQNELQHIQHTCSWDVPDKLLGSQDPNVRFFAALTFTVKINRDGSALEELDLQALLEKLLFWLIRLVEERESLLVLRKLCSTLVTYFILPNAKWRLCIHHTMCCLHARQFVDESSSKSFPSTFQLADLLSPIARSAVIMFATILAEDATRIDHSSRNFDYCHKRIESNIDDVTNLMRYAFQLFTSDKTDSPSDAMQCYLSWFSYAGEEYSDSSDQLETLRTLFVPAMKFLTLDSTFEAAAHFFIDLFTSRDLDLTQSEINGFHNLLTSSWASDHISKLESGEAEDDSLLMAQLALAMGQCLSKKLIRSHERFVFFMTLYHRLTVAQNFETIDQGLSNAIVDFWEDYTSIAPAYDPESSEEQPIYEAAKDNWLQALEELVSGAALPTEENGELTGLMNDDPFSEYRSRVRMAIEGSYTEFEIAVFKRLVEIALKLDQDIQDCNKDKQSTQGRRAMKYAMGRLEFTLFCICGLSDSMERESNFNSLEDELLERLFGSSLFSSLLSQNIHYPTKLRKRAISIIGEQERFFRSRPQQLLAALSMLFASSELADLHQISALAIHKLADQNRALLVPQLNQFLYAAEQLIPLNTVDSLTKEYIVGSVGSVIQAHIVDEAWFSALLQICNAIQKSMDTISGNTQNTQQIHEDRLNHAQEALGYLKALGKALQGPSSQTVTVDDHEDERESSKPQITQSLEQIQSNLAQFLGIIIEPHRDDGPLLIALCDVLRTGFRETKPGPFTFTPAVIATFVTTTPLSNPCVDVAVSTSASFLTSNMSKREGSENAIIQLLQFTRMVVANLAGAEQDPDLAHSCVEFLSCFSQAHLDLLVQIPFEDILPFFSFTITCLQGVQQAPKRSASQVWKILFERPHDKAKSREFLDRLFETLGPPLASALVDCFGGNAARSELTWLTEPFRKMVSSQPQAKIWIEQALFSSSFPGLRASVAEKRRFAAQVIYLRGDKRTQTVVKEFWLTCRGAPTAYG